MLSLSKYKNTILSLMLLVSLGLLAGGNLWNTRTTEETQETARTSRFRLGLIEPTSTVTPFPSPLPLPPSKYLSGGTQVFQTYNNCGPASLSMALSHYGISLSQQTLGQDLRPYQNSIGDNDDKSVTLDELAARAQEAGFRVYHRPAGSIELIQRFINLDIPVIARTWLTPGEDIGHYRVVTGYDRSAQTLLQDDSLQGADLTYTNEAFLELWRAFNYEYVVLVPEDTVTAVEAILGEAVDERLAWEQALAISDRALEQDSSDLYAHFNRSVALYHLDRYQESIASFEAVQDRLPSRMLWYQLDPLLSYYQIGAYDTFEELSERILTNDNMAYSELHFLRAKIYELRGQDQQAQESYALARRYNHEDGYWLANID